MCIVSLAGGGTDRLPPVMPVNEIDWTSEKSCREFARRRLARTRAYWNLVPVVDDDSLPTIQNLAGTGAVAASFVKDPVLSHEENTNYLDCPVMDWDRDIHRIGFSPDNVYYKAQMYMLREFIESWDGTYGIVPFTHFDPLDLCNQWRGNDLFFDYYDHEEELTTLLEKATEGVLQLEKHMHENFMYDYSFEGIAKGVWTPGNYLSCDAGDMSSPELLAKYGVPYTERIVTEWGGAYLHHHEMGLHQIPTWARCRNLTLQFPNRDPNTDHLANVMTEEQLKSSFDVALGFIATYDEFVERAEYWAQGKCAVKVRCETQGEAEDVVQRTSKLRNF